MDEEAVRVFNVASARGPLPKKMISNIILPREIYCF